MPKATRILIRILVAIVAIGLVMGLLYGAVLVLVFTPLGYQLDLFPIKWEIKKIPHVELIDAWGHEDIYLDDIWAKLNIRGKGTMTFGNLTAASFHGSDSLQLCQIGDLRLGTHGFVPYEFYGAYIDVASGGPLAELFPFGITNVQTAIEHYSDLYTIFAGWSKYPDTTRFTNQFAVPYFFFVEVREDRNPRESNWWGKDVDRLNEIFSQQPE